MSFLLHLIILLDVMIDGGELLPIPIVAHDGCWIGANSTILPGTVIEKGCVIAAGSVVKGLLKSNRLYAGVPAKEIRQLE